MFNTASLAGDPLFQTIDRMTNCVVYKKEGLSTSFELYEEATNQFLVACVLCPSLSPMLLFVRLTDCHMRRFDELCCNINFRQYAGKMIPDWMSGHMFTLTSFEGNDLCKIK